MTTKLDFYFLQFNLNGKNWIMDNWRTYIASLTPRYSIDDYQFLRPDSLTLKIKVNMSQNQSLYNNTNAEYHFNYLRVTFKITDGQYPITAEYFYKVLKQVQIAQQTIELDLELDVLNTYVPLNRTSQATYVYTYKLSDKSVVLREHKSRFYRNSADPSLSYRKIDKFPEGIEATLFKKNEENIYFEKTSNNPVVSYQNSWYLIYMNNNNPVSDTSDTQSKYVNPVRLMIASDLGYTLNIPASTGVTKRIDANNLVYTWRQNEELICIRDIDKSGANNIQVTIGNTTYTLVARGSYNANEYSMIIFRHKDNDDTTFIQVYGYQWDSNNNVSVVLLGSVGYFDIKYCNSCLIKKEPLWTSASDEYTAYFAVVNNSVYFEYPIGSGDQSAITQRSKTFSDIDLTDPKLIKVVCVPYPPIPELLHSIDTPLTSLSGNLVWNTSYELLEASSINDVYFNYNYSSNINPLSQKNFDFTTIQSMTRQDNKLKIYESKLYHSDYYLPKFVYDSFTFTFQLELLNTNVPSFSINYVISKNVCSKFMFMFNDYYSDYETQDYNNVLIIERNNEVTLYTNAYMDYMNLGYKFDIKSMESQNTANWVGVALSTIGAVASFVSSIYTGGVGIVSGVSLLTTATGGTIRAIQTAQQNDRNMAQKQLQLKSQSTSVSTSSDLDLLKAYSDNVAKICYYGLSETMEEAMYDYFYYNGYATRRYLNDKLYECQRVNFNFIQAEIEFYGAETRINSEHLGKIKECFKDGVTIFHYLQGGFYQSDTTPYEYKQIYENWEKDIYDSVNS